MQRRTVEVYDIYSGMGGTFTVEVVEEVSATKVKVRVWYGKATKGGWESWPEWDGFRMEAKRSELRNKRQLSLFSRT